VTEVAPATSGNAVDPQAFRGLISRWASGVSVVTAREGDRDSGLTVNSLVSVSLHPPTLLVCLTHDADSTPVIQRTRRFAVNLLAAAQRPLSERFAQAIPAHEKFSGVALHRKGNGPARLDGALAAFECEVVQIYTSTDHQLVLGQVVDQEIGPDVVPLLFYRSGYGEPSGPDTVKLPPPRR
jgi:3-hydroxy-9,10-secoandrosta-1,3,5(10)-triene-9,17-dione monooxygenase reductase component